MQRLLRLLLLVSCSCVYAQTPAGGDYIIKPGDVLQVWLLNHPEWSAPVTVQPDGKISTPLIGDTVAGGKTPQQLISDLEKALAGYGAPKVTVIVAAALGRYERTP